MEMKAHAYSPSSCGKSDEKPSLIHTRPSRRDGYRLFRLSGGAERSARVTPWPSGPSTPSYSQDKVAARVRMKEKETAAAQILYTFQDLSSG